MRQWSPELFRDPAFESQLLELHRATTTEELHKAFLNMFRFTGGAAACTLCAHPTRPARPGYVVSRRPANGKVIPVDWKAHFESVPMLPEMHDPSRAIFHLSDTPVPEEELLASPFFKKFFRPFGFRYATGLNLFRRRRWLGALILVRTPRQGDFNDNDHAFLKGLQRSAATALWRIERAEKERLQHQTLEKAIASLKSAILLVDQKGKVSFATPSARAWLRSQKDPDRLPAGLNRKIQENASSDDGGLQSLSFREPDGTKVAARFRRLPSRRHPLHWLEIEADDSSDHSSRTVEHELWPRLTPAEQRILPYLLQGLTTAQIAGKLGRSGHTLKKQIRSILAKANVKRRTALIAKFQTIGSMLDLDEPTPSVDG